jgi:hypothetical protein
MGLNTSPQAGLLFRNVINNLEYGVGANHPVDAQNFHPTAQQDGSVFVTCAASNHFLLV